jgi:anti-anti-sigma factor
MTAIVYPHLSVEQGDGITIARLRDREIWDVYGEAGNVPAIAEALRGLIEDAGATSLLVDLSDVEFMCTAMLGELFRLKARLEEVQGQLILCGLTAPLVREVFRISGLDRHFEIVEAAWVALARC